MADAAIQYHSNIAAPRIATLRTGLVGYWGNPGPPRTVGTREDVREVNDVGFTRFTFTALGSLPSPFFSAPDSIEAVTVKGNFRIKLGMQGNAKLKPESVINVDIMLLQDSEKTSKRCMEFCQNVGDLCRKPCKEWALMSRRFTTGYQPDGGTGQRAAMHPDCRKRKIAPSRQIALTAL